MGPSAPLRPGSTHDHETSPSAAPTKPSPAPRRASGARVPRERRLPAADRLPSLSSGRVVTAVALLRRARHATASSPVLFVVLVSPPSTSHAVRPLRARAAPLGVGRPAPAPAWRPLQRRGRSVRLSGRRRTGTTGSTSCTRGRGSRRRRLRGRPRRRRWRARRLCRRDRAAVVPHADGLDRALPGGQQPGSRAVAPSSVASSVVLGLGRSSPCRSRSSRAASSLMHHAIARRAARRLPLRAAQPRGRRPRGLPQRRRRRPRARPCAGSSATSTTVRSSG